MDNEAGPGGTAAARLGFEDGQVVMELGWDDDTDQELRDQIEEVIGSAIEDETYDGVADAVLLWWRDGDGDLIDDCVDALTTLADKGFVLLLVPKAGDPDHVEAADIQEAAQTAGLKVSSTTKAGENWLATKLVQGGQSKQR
ncbi:DUF3052 domain-containing protein [Calidifontibacter sp. DB0510]|uniref:DUF3052 domain-containing protein n=1 Tax=Metallococcus carri TaxID=1656884 RepID=A0A967EG93_9MICO|nr:DUF3052 domain-containing protein [Metallococcus carri]NHN57361.1 DUF3052 domain-containing protein [Metallococcus carri]NOP39139.1 DUF3052 family protein [Calidifontibacter sp. DB2511S]